MIVAKSNADCFFTIHFHLSFFQAELSYDRRLHAALRII